MRRGAAGKRRRRVEWAGEWRALASQPVGASRAPPCGARDARAGAPPAKRPRVPLQQRHYDVIGLALIAARRLPRLRHLRRTGTAGASATGSHAGSGSLIGQARAGRAGRLRRRRRAVRDASRDPDAAGRFAPARSCCSPRRRWRSPSAGPRTCGWAGAVAPRRRCSAQAELWAAAQPDRHDRRADPRRVPRARRRLPALAAAALGRGGARRRHAPRALGAGAAAARHARAPERAPRHAARAGRPRARRARDARRGARRSSPTVVPRLRAAEFELDEPTRIEDIRLAHNEPTEQLALPDARAS